MRKERETNTQSTQFLSVDHTEKRGVKERVKKVISLERKIERKNSGADMHTHREREGETERACVPQ